LEKTIGKVLENYILYFNECIQFYLAIVKAATEKFNTYLTKQEWRGNKKPMAMVGALFF
jgi:hypothetical protein